MSSMPANLPRNGNNVRFLRNRLAPVVVWLCAVGALLMLSRDRFAYVDGVGLAETVAVQIAPAENGLLYSLAVDLFDSVQAGQTVAIMDDTLMRAELMIAEAELGRLRSTVDAERRRLDEERALREESTRDELRRYQMNEEDARLRLLDMIVQDEANAIRLERLKIEMERYQRLTEQLLGEQSLYDEARLNYEELRRSMEENKKAIRAAEEQLAKATARRLDRESRLDVPVSEAFIEPIRQAISVQEAHVQQIREMRAQRVLQAPIDGRVTQVLRRAGETVLAGDPIVMISDTRSQRVVAYLREGTAGNVAPDDEVVIRSKHRPEIATSARVLRVGAGVEELPVAAWTSPFLPERGYPVLIHQLSDDVLVPGERVTVRIRSAN